MAAKDFTKVEYGSLLLNFLLSQYKNKTNMIGLHQRFGDDVFDVMEDNIFSIFNMCDIEKATGNTLDAAASLIGLERMQIRIPSTVWTLDETPFTGYPFGDKDYIIYEECPDSIFVDCIKSYAYTQTCYGSLDDVLITVGYILGIDHTTITIANPSEQTWSLTVPSSVPVGRRFLLGVGGQDFRTPNGGFLWAKPAGVTFNFIYS